MTIETPEGEKKEIAKLRASVDRLRGTVKWLFPYFTLVLTLLALFIVADNETRAMIGLVMFILIFAGFISALTLPSTWVSQSKGARRKRQDKSN